MTHDQYIAYERKGQWFVTVDGLQFGPFQNRDAAISHAVDAAKLNEKAGIGGEVSWSDPNDGTPTVYKSGQEDRRT